MVCELAVYEGCFEIVVMIWMVSGTNVALQENVFVKKSDLVWTGAEIQIKNRGKYYEFIITSQIEFLTSW